MAEGIIHNFVTAKPDSADTTLVSASEWNDLHAFTGGLQGQTVTYNTGGTNNFDYVDGPKRYSATHTVSGSTALPIDILPISIVHNTPVLALITLRVEAATLSGGQLITLTLRLNTGGIYVISDIGAATGTRNYVFIRAMGIPGTESFDVRVSGASNITQGIFNVEAFTVGNVP